MSDNEDKKLIFATEYNGEWHPEHLIENLEDSLDGLEYTDVKNGEYQVWEWPSGDIYALVADREVDPGKEYSTQYGNDGENWKVVIKKIETDKKKVNEAISTLL